MESIIPKCINNNACLNICNVKTCKSIPFLCGDNQCSCHSQHQQCTTTLKQKSMRQKFINKLKKTSAQLIGYFTQIDDLFKGVIKQIEKSFAHIKNIAQNFGLSKLEREVYQKLKQKKFSQLTGEMINKVEVDLMGNKKQFQIKNIEKEKKQIQKQTKILIQMLEGLTNLNLKVEEKKSNKYIKQSIISFKLDSIITQDVETLSSFFSKKIMAMNLLYRASENNFQASKFHEKCDGKQHTITILKTEFGKIIGGYTPIPWDKSKSCYQTDSSMQSFIFSLTNKHKLKLIQGRQDRTILQTSLGPVFGDGDILIYDNANQSNSSYTKTGNTYNFHKQYSDTQQSFLKFVGQTNGNKFKIQEWQVYSIVFK